MSKTKKSETLAKPDEKASVSVDTTDADVLKWNSEGKALVFDPERFKVLPDSIVRDLSHANAGSYFAMYNQHLAIEKDRRAGTFGKPRIRTESVQIIDPLGGHEGAKTNYRVKNTPEGKQFEKDYHVYLAAAWEVEDRKELGYELVTPDDPITTRGNTTSSTSRVIRHKGEDELVWMKLPKRKFEQHAQAVAAKSAALIKQQPQEFDAKVQELSKGKAKGMEIEPEEEAVKMTDAQFKATEGK